MAQPKSFTVLNYNTFDSGEKTAENSDDEKFVSFDSHTSGRFMRFDSRLSDIIGPGPEASLDVDDVQAQIDGLENAVVQRMEARLVLISTMDIYLDSSTCGIVTSMTLHDLLTSLHSYSSDRIPRVGHSSAVREIHQHDLRYLSSRLPNQFEQPTFLIRKHVILMSLPPLRAVITAKKITLISPRGADRLLKQLHDYMREIVWGKGSPGITFELKAMDAIFSTAVSLLDQEFSDMLAKTNNLSEIFKKTKTMSSEQQEQTRALKNGVFALSAKVVAHQSLLQNLLSSQVDLSLTSLTLFEENPQLYWKPLEDEVRHSAQEVERMMESYLMDFGTLNTKLNVLNSQIQNSMDLMSFRLDTARNDLLVVDMSLAIISVVVTLGKFEKWGLWQKLNA